MNLRRNVEHSAHEHLQLRMMLGLNIESGEAMVGGYQREMVLSHAQSNNLSRIFPKL